MPAWWTSWSRGRADCGDEFSLARPARSGPASLHGQPDPPHPRRRRSGRCARRPAPAAQGGGIPGRAGHVPGGNRGRRAEGRVRPGAHRPELHPRHHQRPGRPGPPRPPARHRGRAARGGDDRLGHRRSRRGSHAPGRARLHPETLGERPRAGHRAHPDRTGRHPAAQRPAGGGERFPAPRLRGDRRRALEGRGQGRGIRRRVGRHAPGARRHRQRGPGGRPRAHHGRERHGQGPRRAAAARRQLARGQAVGQRQHGRPEREHLRERTLRARQGRVHRRQDGPRGPLRAGRRRHAVPGRDRQRAAGAAGQAAAAAGNGRVRARGLLAHPARRRAAAQRHERRPASRSGRRALPARPALPAQHRGNPPAAAARPARGHPGAGRAFPGPPRRPLPQARHRPGRRRAGRAAGPFVAGQRARTRPRAGTRRPDDHRRAGARGGPRALGGRRDAARRRVRHAPRWRT